MIRLLQKPSDNDYVGSIITKNSGGGQWIKSQIFRW